MRVFTCIDCTKEGNEGVEYATDNNRGRLPTRCSEHQKLHAYALLRVYLERKKPKLLQSP